MVCLSKLPIGFKEVNEMFWCSFIVTALLAAGIILVLNIDKKCLNTFWEATRDTVRSNVNKRKNREKHISLKKKTELLIKGKKQNFVVRTFRETEEILAETHRRHRIKGIYIKIPPEYISEVITDDNELAELKKADKNDNDANKKSKKKRGKNSKKVVRKGRKICVKEVAKNLFDPDCGLLYRDKKREFSDI